MGAPDFSTVIESIRESRKIINATLMPSAKEQDDVFYRNATTDQIRASWERAKQFYFDSPVAKPMGSFPAFSKTSGVTWQGD